MLKSSLLLFGLVVGCTDLPRDPDGTLDRVVQERRIRIGQVEGSAAGPWNRVVTRLAAATGARPVVRRDALEPLLLELEAGTLDLVVGARFDTGTPWASRVTIGPPLAPATTPVGTTGSHVVARNGENAWIMLVQRQVKAESKR